MSAQPQLQSRFPSQAVEQVPISLVLLPGVMAPRVRFTEPFRILVSFTSHTCSSHPFLVSSPAPPSVFLSNASPVFVLCFLPLSLPSAPRPSRSSRAAFGHFGVSHHPGLAGHSPAPVLNPAPPKAVETKAPSYAVLSSGWLDSLGLL